MGKRKKHNKRKILRKSSLLVKIYRFFVPKDFKAELTKGAIIGERLRQGKISPKAVPTWWLGKGIRKLIDPKHKMEVGKKK